MFGRNNLRHIDARYNGTTIFSSNRSAILQMMGRAGRPGFDSTGVAVVMTSQVTSTCAELMSTTSVVVLDHFYMKMRCICPTHLSQSCSWVSLDPFVVLLWIIKLRRSLICPAPRQAMRQTRKMERCIVWPHSLVLPGCLFLIVDHYGVYIVVGVLTG